MEVVLLTLDPFKTRLKNSFFLAFVHTASLVSIFVFLAWFFRKRPLPFAHVENSLDSQANGNRGTGTPCLFAGKNDAFDSLQTPFPTVTTHFVIDIHTPPLGLVLHPAYRLSRISPLLLKTFFYAVSGIWICSPRHTNLVARLVQTYVGRRKLPTCVNLV